MGSGLSTGFAGLAAGWAIGLVGDAAVRSYAFQPRIFVGMVLILIFAEVLGEFGLLLDLMLLRTLRAHRVADLEHKGERLRVLLMINESTTYYEIKIAQKTQINKHFRNLQKSAKDDRFKSTTPLINCNCGCHQLTAVSQKDASSTKCQSSLQ